MEFDFGPSTANKENKQPSLRDQINKKRSLQEFQAQQKKFAEATSKPVMKQQEEPSTAVQEAKEEAEVPDKAESDEDQEIEIELDSDAMEAELADQLEFDEEENEIPPEASNDNQSAAEQDDKVGSEQAESEKKSVIEDLPPIDNEDLVDLISQKSSVKSDSKVKDQVEAEKKDEVPATAKPKMSMSKFLGMKRKKI